MNGKMSPMPVPWQEPDLTASNAAVLKRSAFFILIFIVFLVIAILNQIAYPDVMTARVVVVRQHPDDSMYTAELLLPEEICRQVTGGAQVTLTLQGLPQSDHLSVKAILPQKIGNHTPVVIFLPEGVAKDERLPDSIQAEVFIPIRGMPLVQRIFSRQTKYFK